MASPLSLVDRNIKIKPSPGKIFINRTYKYLSPSMKLYGEEFKTKMRMLSGLAVGIQDFGINNTPEERQFNNEIYYLFDTNGEFAFNKYINSTQAKLNFFRVVSWLREQSFYVNDYPYDGGKSGSQHVVILKLPLPLMDNFLKGNYTELYSKEIINEIIPKTVKVIREEKINPVYAVLTKTEEYEQEYLKQLNHDYGTTLQIKDIKHHSQYDIPPLPKNEILRW